MDEAASIFLRSDIEIQDGLNLARWMNDRLITEYLNEQDGISKDILGLLDRIPVGSLTYHFNQHGRFFMVCINSGRSIGFIKLKTSSNKKCEVVYAIGEKSLWGRGFGKHALNLALSKAFFEMRLEQVTAQIMKSNLRSIRAAAACGMTCVSERNGMLVYDITFAEYLEQQEENRSPRNHQARA